MSQSSKSSLTIASVVVGLLVTTYSFIQSWAITPYRVEQTEKAIKILQEDQRTTREILIRIEERVVQLQRSMKQANNEQ